MSLKAIKLYWKKPCGYYIWRILKSCLRNRNTLHSQIYKVHNGLLMITITTINMYHNALLFFQIQLINWCKNWNQIITPTIISLIYHITAISHTMFRKGSIFYFSICMGLHEWCQNTTLTSTEPLYLNWIKTRSKKFQVTYGV